MPADPFDLARFVSAQEDAYDTALAELRSGRKRSHWMWFVFPQLKALGRSPTAQFYGLASRAEAAAFLQHDLLGPRLLKCAEAAINASAPDLRTLLGAPDDLKFTSSMTLFDAVQPGDVFQRALERWCAGRPDRLTLDLLQRVAPG